MFKSLLSILVVLAFMVGCSSDQPAPVKPDDGYSQAFVRVYYDGDTELVAVAYPPNKDPGPGAAAIIRIDGTSQIVCDSVLFWGMGVKPLGYWTRTDSVPWSEYDWSTSLPLGPDLKLHDGDYYFMSEISGGIYIHNLEAGIISFTYWNLYVEAYGCDYDMLKEAIRRGCTYE